MKGSDWRGRAACSRLEPDIFYPVGDGAYAREMTEIAKQACLSCPVRAECLRQALETGEQYGIWGGMTPEERRDLARRKHDPQKRERRRAWAQTIRSGTNTRTP